MKLKAQHNVHCLLAVFASKVSASKLGRAFFVGSAFLVTASSDLCVILAVYHFPLYTCDYLAELSHVSSLDLFEFLSYVYYLLSKSR